MSATKRADDGGPSDLLKDPPKVEEEKKAMYKPGGSYVVADGKSIVGSPRGHLKPGDKVRPSDFGDGEKAVARLYAKGVLVAE